MNRYFKTEGNIMYPDEKILTWGPFYFHSLDLAKKYIDKILKDIVDWVNLKDPSLNIEPENFYKSTGGRMCVFKIEAWKDDNNLEDCKGLISVDEIFFEDEENN